MSAFSPQGRDPVIGALPTASICHSYDFVHVIFHCVPFIYMTCYACGIYLRLYHVFLCTVYAVCCLGLFFGHVGFLFCELPFDILNPYFKNCIVSPLNSLAHPPTYFHNLSECPLFRKTCVSCPPVLFLRCGFMCYVRLPYMHVPLCVCCVQCVPPCVSMPMAGVYSTSLCGVCPVHAAVCSDLCLCAVHCVLCIYITLGLCLCAERLCCECKLLCAPFGRPGSVSACLRQGSASPCCVSVPGSAGACAPSCVSSTSVRAAVCAMRTAWRLRVRRGVAASRLGAQVRDSGRGGCAPAGWAGAGGAAGPGGRGLQWRGRRGPR